MSQFSQEERQIIDSALAILERHMMRDSVYLKSPAEVKDYLRLQLAGLEHEVFGVLFLDTQHRVIKYAELFRGTLDAASVYPREVAKEALAVNAGAVIFTHNHPSGVAEPSDADRRITQRLREALGLFEIRTLDHIVVGNGETVSFAERGWI